MTSPSATRSARTSPGATSPSTPWRSRSTPTGCRATVVDPFGGRADLAAGVLRAVGDPGARFREDALRMLRAVRFAATLGFVVEPATRAAIAAEAPLARPRLRGADLRRAGAAARGGAAVDRAAARRGDGPPRRDRPGAGAPARHPTGEDPRRGPLGSHAGGPWTRRRRPWSTASRSRARRRCSTTSASRPPSPTATSSATTRSGRSSRRRGSTGSVRRGRSRRGSPASSATTCSPTTPEWSDAAIRRFIRRVGLADLDELLDLRAADNVGSGLPPNARWPRRAARALPGAGRGPRRARARRPRRRRRRPHAGAGPRARPGAGPAARRAPGARPRRPDAQRARPAPGDRAGARGRGRRRAAAGGTPTGAMRGPAEPRP